ncbi:hypothetical protein BZA05DRAFT_403338 [Tricharina praecox]|uniref:uncharacterized protein n=1 Tax=Tricharina praecox TaxID=43433 RepID=UPI00221F0F45|nr:uncharacterized protein BZA05DRAFT_403338 [Tricharina praecox]KAI5848981.1 hypothetical protein BZA05DRAFT_403338 [Tricharina praecox]
MGKTFKLTDILLTIPLDVLRAAIANQLPVAETQGLIVSLCRDPEQNDSPYHQIATVTFPGQEPAALSKCKEDVPVSWDLVGVGIVVADVDFYNMTPLYAATNPRCDIIAVTGLAGHGFGSWKSRGKHDMWLRDFLPQDLKKLQPRILTWGYDAKLTKSETQNNLVEYGRQFMDAVNAIREDKYRPIIFIGHSFGGLVIKQALCNPNTEINSMDEQIYNSCAGIFFFGVPNKGLNHENLLGMVEEAPSKALVEDLVLKTNALQVAYENFLQYFRTDDLHFTSYYETKLSPTVSKNATTGKFERTGLKVMMVTKDSAMWTSPNQAIQKMVPIDADHSEIVKFMSLTDVNYLDVRGRIERCMADSQRVILERWRKLGRPLEEPI